MAEDLGRWRLVFQRPHGYFPKAIGGNASEKGPLVPGGIVAIDTGSNSMGIVKDANHAPSAGPSPTNGHVKGAMAIGEVFGSGEKITTVVLEGSDRDIGNSNLSSSAFSVKDRAIAKVYANQEAARASQGVNGRFVVIELNPDDSAAFGSLWRSRQVGQTRRSARPGRPWLARWSGIWTSWSESRAYENPADP